MAKRKATAETLGAKADHLRKLARQQSERASMERRVEGLNTRYQAIQYVAKLATELSGIRKCLDDAEVPVELQTARLMEMAKSLGMIALRFGEDAGSLLQPRAFEREVYVSTLTGARNQLMVAWTA